MGLEQELDEIEGKHFFQKVQLRGEYPVIDASDLVRGIKDSLSVKFSNLTRPEVLATLITSLSFWPLKE